MTKAKVFYISKNNIKTKRQARNSEHIFAYNSLDKWLISKIHKKQSHLNKKESNLVLKTGQKTQIDSSPRTYRWSRAHEISA